MTARLTHRAGDTLALDCVAYTDADLSVPRDLSTVTVTAVMDAPMQAEINLTVEKTAPYTDGAFIIRATAAQTRNWRPTTWYARVIYTEADGDVSSTEVFQIEVTDSFTPA